MHYLLHGNKKFKKTKLKGNKKTRAKKVKKEQYKAMKEIKEGRTSKKDGYSYDLL